MKFMLKLYHFGVFVGIVLAVSLPLCFAYDAVGSSSWAWSWLPGLHPIGRVASIPCHPVSNWWCHRLKVTPPCLLSNLVNETIPEEFVTFNQIIINMAVHCNLIDRLQWISVFHGLFEEMIVQSMFVLYFNCCFGYTFVLVWVWEDSAQPLLVL